MRRVLGEMQQKRPKMQLLGREACEKYVYWLDVRFGMKMCISSVLVDRAYTQKLAFEIKEKHEGNKNIQEL